MYERVFQTQSRVDAVDQTESLQENSTSNSSVMDVTEQAVKNPVVQEKPISQDGSAAPATLERSALQEWFVTTVDVILSLVPLFFLVIAILCLLLNGKPLSAYGESIKAITLLSPTIFPIVYAAVLGKALRRMGLYKAEKSSTIGTLEQLMGSSSFFASIERQFGLRRVNFLGIGIIFAWLLSPLGGQSSLRLLSTAPSDVKFNSTVLYHSTEGFSNDSMFSTDMEESAWSRYAPLYMTAIQTSRQTFEGPRDYFGNVKIPDLSMIDAKNDTSDWYEIKEGKKTTYSSLLGHPIADIPRTGNLTFPIETSYWEMNCRPFSKSFNLNPKNDNSTNPEWHFSRLRPGDVGPSFDMVPINYTQFMNDFERQNDHTLEFSFYYFSKKSIVDAVNSTCTASLRLVESQIACQQGSCSVQRVRNLRNNHPTWARLTSPASRESYIAFITLLMNVMPGADLGPGNPLTPSSEMVEQFIMDPALTQMISSPREIDMRSYWVDMSTLSREVFSQRLSMATNTLWSATIGLQYHLGDLKAADIEKGERSIDMWNATTAQGQNHSGEHYVCSIPFAAITITISTFLFVAANVALVLGCITRVPDVLGYVSTYARDDPYFNHHVPSHLGGMDAARSMRDVRVRIGDVRKDGEVGHVAFATMDAEPERVNKKRLYD